MSASSGTERAPLSADASGFRHVRAARRSAVAEDYCELIADLIACKGEARSVELAERFGVAPATVAKCIARLRREGLVRAERYGALQLSAEGVRIARESRARHRTVVEFLRGIGVSAAVAERDAEGIEHHVSAETLAAFARLTARRPGAA